MNTRKRMAYGHQLADCRSKPATYSDLLIIWFQYSILYDLVAELVGRHSVRLLACSFCWSGFVRSFSLHWFRFFPHRGFSSVGSSWSIQEHQDRNLEKYPRTRTKVVTIIQFLRATAKLCVPLCILFNIAMHRCWAYDVLGVQNQHHRQSPSGVY